MKKQINPIDLHVGQKLKMRRLLMGFSQSRLGKELNLTFQQIQKYEKGFNRMGASRLFQIAKILNVPVQYFFENIEEKNPNKLNRLYEDDASKKANKDDYQLTNYINTAEGLKLNKAICDISNVNLRRKLISLIVTISENHKKTSQENKNQQDDDDDYFYDDHGNQLK